MTSLGIGQALVTVLNEKGIPTEVAATHLCPPKAFMGPMPDQQYMEVVQSSDLNSKYKETVNPESAYEILNKKLAQALEEKAAIEEAKIQQKNEQASSSGRHEKSTLEQVLASPITKEVGKQLVRGVFGMLFGTATKSTNRKRSPW